jgi:hypothetical protein
MQVHVRVTIVTGEQSPPDVVTSDAIAELANMRHPNARESVFISVDINTGQLAVCIGK